MSIIILQAFVPRYIANRQTVMLICVSGNINNCRNHLRDVHRNGSKIQDFEPLVDMMINLFV